MPIGEMRRSSASAAPHRPAPPGTPPSRTNPGPSPRASSPAAAAHTAPNPAPACPHQARRGARPQQRLIQAGIRRRQRPPVPAGPGNHGHEASRPVRIRQRHVIRPPHPPAAPPPRSPRTMPGSSARPARPRTARPIPAPAARSRATNSSRSPVTDADYNTAARSTHAAPGSSCPTPRPAAPGTAATAAAAMTAAPAPA